MQHIYSQVWYKDVLVDKSEANLSVTSSAVLYGLSVYTVFPVKISNDDRLAFSLPGHYQRLVRSAAIVGIDTFASKWTYDKLKSNPKKYGGDNGNAEITHSFLLDFFGDKIVSSLEVYNFSILSSVSRIRNKLLKKNPQFDMRIRNKPKVKIKD